jgi:hypothetical protein
MRMHSAIAALIVLALAGALAPTPAAAQADVPIIATFTVPVQIANLLTAAINVRPSVTCILLQADNGVVGIGTTAVPLVATQATTTTQSYSSFSGNVVVTVRPNKLASGALVAARQALANATTYVCFFGTTAPPSTTGFSPGTSEYGYLIGYDVVAGGKSVVVEPHNAVIFVKGAFKAP